MVCANPTRPPGVRRRTLLASLASLPAASLAGCDALRGLNGGHGVPDGAPMTDGAFAELIHGNVVALANGLDGAVFRPGDSDHPVQDALDAVNASGGGHVYLPPTRVTETGPVRPYANTAVFGFGTGVSVLDVTKPGADGVRFDRNAAVQHVALDGFELRGPGLNQETGVAVHYVSGTGNPANDPSDVHIGRLYCREWANSVLRVEKGVWPFQCRYDYLRADDCDAGAANGLLDWRSDSGPANRFGTVVAYPESSASGAASTVLSQAGGELDFEAVTVGGTAGTVIEQVDGHLAVGRVHWEPERQPTPTAAVCRLAGAGSARIGEVVVATGRAAYAYELARGFGSKLLVAPSEVGGQLTENVVHVSGAGAADSRSWYFGQGADVDVDSGVADGGHLRVLGDAGTGLA